MCETGEGGGFEAKEQETLIVGLAWWDQSRERSSRDNSHIFIISMMQVQEVLILLEVKMESTVERVLSRWIIN